MVMMTIISALTISLFLVEQDCPFIATLGGKADICERKFINERKTRFHMHNPNTFAICCQLKM